VVEQHQIGWPAEHEHAEHRNRVAQDDRDRGGMAAQRLPALLLRVWFGLSAHPLFNARRRLIRTLAPEAGVDLRLRPRCATACKGRTGTWPLRTPISEGLPQASHDLLDVFLHQ